jgi:hypothetical protein
MSKWRHYFTTVGVLSHFTIFLFVILIAKHFNLSPIQLLYRASEKLSLHSSVIDKALFTNSIDYPIEYSHISVLINDAHLLPQIDKLLTNKLSIKDFPIKEVKYFPTCQNEQLMTLLTCALVDKNEEVIVKAKRKILLFKVILPSVSANTGNSWELAFAYNTLKHLIDFSAQEKTEINEKLTQALKHYLLLLNDEEASLWHSRVSLASQMWLTLKALDNVEKYLLSNAMPHFFSAVSALSMTEAWPEGYNYWVNSRAFYTVLALSSYVNGTEYDNWHPKIYALLNKIGRWHIQATRPDWQIEPLGDEGPRLDLKDDTRRIIDIIAQVTQNPIFKYYSNKLAKLHAWESYHASYRWGWLLFYPADLYLFEETTLPLMEVFGKETLGQIYIRESWGKGSSFITYRAGNAYSHHGHYDNGHVSLFKGAPLLVNSSQPSKIFSENRLNYGIRTIAKNSIIIQRENERVNIGFNYDNHIADGGQRVTMPLSSGILSVLDWFDKSTKSQVLSGGILVSSENKAKYSYLRSDLTKAYNSSWYDDNGLQGKVELIERDILYLRKQDTLIIKDKVKSKAKNQIKVIFHTMNKPIVKNENILQGTAQNGIISSKNKLLKINNGNSYLTSEIIADIHDVLLIGGDNYKFYVEKDGSDAQFNGDNFDGGLTPKQIKNAAGWRFEIRSKRKKTQEIITVHRPSLNDYRSEKTKVKILSDGVSAYIIGKQAIIFSASGFNGEYTQELLGKDILICDGNKSRKAPCYSRDWSSSEREESS